MPRPPLFNHPLRKLRAIIGYSQEKLARELGVSGVAIKKIENGKLKLSGAMKKRLLVQTGVDPASLDRKTPVFIDKRDYTKERFETHRENNRTRKPPGEVELRSSHVILQSLTVKEMNALTEAAAHANRFWLLHSLWGDWLKATIKELNLSKAFDQAVEKRRFESTASSFRLDSTARQKKQSSAKRKRRA